MIAEVELKTILKVWFGLKTKIKKDPNKQQTKTISRDFCQD